MQVTAPCNIYLLYINPDEEVETNEAKNEEENTTPAEEDTDLILNISDQDRLDFEPDECILDETKEVNLLINMYSSLMTRFRTNRRPGLPRTRIDEASEPEQALRNSCELLRQRKELHASS